MTVATYRETIAAVHWGRLQLLVYMGAILIWFVPAHTRGRMTMGPRDASGTAHARIASCCEAPAEKHATPTAKDKANCAVCFWAAGLLPVAPVVFEVRPTDVERARADAAVAQCAAWFVPSDRSSRGPPARAV